MIRLGLAIAIISTIYVHSPVRPRGDLSEDLSRWTQKARDGVTASVLRPSLARDLATEAAAGALRQSVGGTRPHRAEPAASTPAPRQPAG